MRTADNADVLFGLYVCWCMAAETSRANMPDRCPHHDQPLAIEPVQTARDGQTELGHWCDLTDLRFDTPERQDAARRYVTNLRRH